MPLEIDKAITSELQRLEAARIQGVEAEVTTEGVTAEVHTEQRGWTLAMYVKKLWAGPWIGGGRIRKDF